MLKYILIFSLLLSCSSTKKENKQENPPVISNCVSELTKNAVIRWGYVYKQNQTEKAYQLNTQGDIYRQDETKIVVRKEKIEDLINSKPNYIESVSRETYCDIYVQVQKEFIKAQALFVPADTMVFVQLINPDAGTNLRALWNPNYEAIGSEGFRKVWAMLDKALPKDQMYLHKK
ncbi:hypothetical protein OAQ99_04320 [Candidatus Kapabacteria bacterium]|nr:hypothetical protein [Candidatus Kapabacteria bacterium]